MTQRLIVPLIVIALLTGAVSTAAATPSAAARSTPLVSTLGWFHAIDAHDRRQLLSYVDPSARGRIDWPRASVPWSKFTDLSCMTRKAQSQTRADVRCTFHESASPSEGNPDLFWDVLLRRTSAGWLIYSYGQG